MKKFLTRLVSLSLMFSLMGAVAAPQAQATGGCSTMVVDKAENWIDDGNYFAPDPSLKPDPTPWHSIRFSVNALYHYCWDGVGGTKKLKVYGFDFCWTILGDDKSPLFDGVTFFPTMHDDATDIWPAGKKVVDDGTNQNCDSTALTAANSIWLLMWRSPYWTVNAVVNLYLYPDDNIPMRTAPGSTAPKEKYFHPSDDPNLSDYYWL